MATAVTTSKSPPPPSQIEAEIPSAISTMTAMVGTAETVVTQTKKAVI